MDNSFFSKFTPKEPKFFPLLKGIVDVIKTAAELMLEFVDKGNAENAADYYKRIKEEERKGDVLSNRIFDELNSTFITPFDREDIHHLATRMDDVTDYINSAAKRIYLYNPKEIPTEAKELVGLIIKAATQIDKAVDELDVLKKSRKRVFEYCQELHVIENQADDVYEHFLIKLFENQKDGVELIKEKEIMYELEKATDAAEGVGKIIKTIIVKYA
jgi:predicted phosphate transport protein (TIGR00153 family)